MSSTASARTFTAAKRSLSSAPPAPENPPSCALEEPTEGHIFFEGTDITAKGTDINAIRRKMGMVFQHFNLFPNMTVRRNITLAPVHTGFMKQEEADKRADELLARVGLSDKAEAYPASLP